MLQYQDFLPWATFASGLIALGASLWSIRKSPWPSVLFWLAAGALCLLGRLPTLSVPLPFHDESEQLTAALAVAEHGRFFGRVFIGTHGPAMTLLLSGLHRLGMPLDSLSLHVLVLLWQMGIGVCLYGIFRQCGVGAIARFAVLPYFLFIAYTREASLTTYNAGVITSLFPLLAVVALLHFRKSRNSAVMFAGCAALGSIPFFKIQFLPHLAVILAFMFSMWLRSERKGRLGVSLVVGLLAPALGVLAYACLNPAVAGYYARSVNWQFGYLRDVSPGLSEKLAMLWFFVTNTLARKQDGGIFLTGLFFPALGSAALARNLLGRRTTTGASPTPHDALLALSLLAAAIVASIVPGRPYLHYILIYVPFLFLAYGLGLKMFWEDGGRLGLVVFAAGAALLFPLSVVSTPEALGQAMVSPLRDFSESFLNTLKQCVRCGGGLLVTHPRYDLYAWTRATPPMPEITDLFTQQKRLAVDPGMFVRVFEAAEPAVVVETDRDDPAYALASAYPELHAVLARDYVVCAAEPKAAIWRILEKRWGLLDACLPCYVRTSGVSDLEYDTVVGYAFRWTSQKEPTIEFSAVGENLGLQLRMLSPFFDQTVDVIFNGSNAGRVQIPKGNDPAQATTCIISLPTIVGTNTVLLKLSRVNEGPQKILPDESRALGVQILEASIERRK